MAVCYLRCDAHPHATTIDPVVTQLVAGAHCRWLPYTAEFSGAHVNGFMTRATNTMVQDPKVLIIEDEQEIRRFLRVSLENHGYRFIESPTGQDGLNLIADEHPDLVLLDLGLPDIDGLTVIRRLRSWSRVPVIVISARGHETDKANAFDAGADDYLTKPFSVVELQARVRVALRHATQDQDEVGEPIFTLGRLRVDLERRLVFVDEKQVHLTPTEYRILTTLVKHSGKVVTHRQLLKEVWGPDNVFDNHYLRVYMTYLRRKIEPNPARPQFVLTDPGIGYRLAS